MSQYFTVHPSHPQQRLILQAATIVRAGGLVVYPTDTAYALGCHIGDKQSLERIRQLRRLDRNHHFTLTCRDLSEISLYARVNDANYRILKHFTPGPFTFILPATREVPRRLVHAKRKTKEIRADLEGRVDLIIDAGSGGILPTTMVDLTGPIPEIRREGMGVFE